MQSAFGFSSSLFSTSTFHRTNTLNPQVHQLVTTMLVLQQKVTHIECTSIPSQQLCHNLLLVAPCPLTQSLSWSQELSRSPRLWYDTMCCHHHVYAFTTGCCLVGMLLILQLNVLLITTHRSILLQNTNVRT